MNLQSLNSKIMHFKRWQRRSPAFRLASEEEHCCLCCGHRFRGNYCPRCSQKAGLGRITWRSVRNGIMDVWGLGSRSMPLSIWQLLYRPGYFIGDYISGKRQLSFPPVKMLFIIAFIYANIFYWFFPEVLKVPLEEQGEVGYKLWIRQHYSLAMLVMSVLAIIPTWVIIRKSPRHPHHTIPEGFFIQVFLCTVSVLAELLPRSVAATFMCFYTVVTFRQLFGYGWWSTTWRFFVCLLLMLLQLLVVVIFALVIAALLGQKSM